MDRYYLISLGCNIVNTIEKWKYDEKEWNSICTIKAFLWYGIHKKISYKLKYKI